MADDEPAEEPDESQEHPIPPSRPFLIGLVLIVLALAILIARPYLGAVVLALLVAFIVHPIQARLAPKVRWPSLAAFIILTGVILILVAPFVFVVWQTLDSLQRIVVTLQDPAAVEARLRGILETFGIEGQEAAQTISMAGQKLAEFAAGAVLPTIMFLFKGLLALVVFLFVLFFGIRDGKKWIEGLKAHTPLSPPDKEELFTGARDSIWAIVMGTFVVSVVQGTIAGIGWWIFGFPDPIFWGFVMIILAVLPFLGAFLVAIPAGILAIIEGDYFSGVGLLIWTVTIVALSDDMLRPYLIGKRSGVHPVFILVGILGGVAVFGVAGFIIGPLIYALIEPIMTTWRKRRYERAVDHGLADGEEMD